MFDTLVSEETPLDDLEAEITELAAHITAATCRWLQLVAEFDRREGWGAWGIRSCAHWLNWRCGIALPAARERVRVAHALADLPAVRASMARGELSYSKVRALTRVATRRNEAELALMARHATAAQLERIVRAYRRVRAVEDLGEVNARHARRRLRWHYDEDRSLVIEARLDPEDGEVVVKALQRLVDGPEVVDDVSAETPFDARYADALVLLAVGAGDADGSERSSPAAERYQVVVEVDKATLAKDAEGAGHLEAGPALAPETIRRLCCDSSSVTVVRDDDGRIIGVSDRRPAIPRSVRRALRKRDITCAWPGCIAQRFVDAHHLRRRAHGGPDSLGNLALLCRYHHRLVHEGGYKALRTDDGVRFFRPDGRLVPAVPMAPRVMPGTRALRLDHRRNGIDIDRGTCASLSEGEPFDLGLTIDAMLGIDDVDLN